MRYSRRAPTAPTTKTLGFCLIPKKDGLADGERHALAHDEDRQHAAADAADDPVARGVQAACDAAGCVRPPVSWRGREGPAGQWPGQKGMGMRSPRYVGEGQGDVMRGLGAAGVLLRGEVIDFMK
eukprot:9581301-Alexandrium_andersonii.AAC.1